MLTVVAASPELARLAREDLVALLQDALNAGAALGFMAPLAEEVAAAFWDDVIEAIAAGHRVLLLAIDGERLIGTAQLDLSQRQNGAHRAEVMKVMVHTSARRRGVGRALMRAVDEHARACGRTTLVLDTRVGDLAEGLYSSMGWIRVGEIPAFARSSNGELHATAVYYKLLA